MIIKNNKYLVLIVVVNTIVMIVVIVICMNMSLVIIIVSMRCALLPPQCPWPSTMCQKAPDVFAASAASLFSILM